MIYLSLVLILLASIFLLLAALLLFMACRSQSDNVLIRKCHHFWRNHRTAILGSYTCWFSAYAIFILFFTGPTDLSIYPDAKTSPYKLPWEKNVYRFTFQGNRSFTSHRELFDFAWDFSMPIGTEILSVRDGTVIEIEDRIKGVGFKSNYIIIQHKDLTRAIYAHILQNGALVNVGDHVIQGDKIALSGMTGQTPWPHLHFAVLNEDGTQSIPISFSDIPSGVPLSARFYRSGNR